MFNKKEIRLDMVVPTSKIALKTSCIKACQGDLEKAERLYAFFVSDLKELPDFDVVPPSPVQQARDMFVNVFSWVDQNQDKIAGYYNLFQQMRQGYAPSSAPIPDVPPIPTD